MVILRKAGVRQKNSPTDGLRDSKKSNTFDEGRGSKGLFSHRPSKNCKAAPSLEQASEAPQFIYFVCPNAQKQRQTPHELETVGHRNGKVCLRRWVQPANPTEGRRAWKLF